jgi:hypothetical protein
VVEKGEPVLQGTKLYSPNDLPVQANRYKVQEVWDANIISLTVQ